MAQWEIRALVNCDMDGKIHYSQEDRVKLLSQLKAVAKGKQLRLVITEYDPQKEEEDQRTLKQNRYYHKLLDIICDYTGDNHMKLHKDLKIELLGKPYIYKDREVIEVPSTRDLTTKTFGDYLEKVFKFASEEFGLILPDPTPYV